jgi:hypothetical protein
MGIWRVSTVERVAERALPGGAIAAIDVVTTRAAWRRRRFQGALIVERGERGGRGRETGHRAPIVATARGASIRAVMRKLVPMLRNDSVIAWALSRGAR